MYCEKKHDSNLWRELFAHVLLFPGQATEGSTVSSIKCDRWWHLDWQCQGVSRAGVG